MSRPNVTDAVIEGLFFARACILDQRDASHTRKDHSWDERYHAALTAINLIISNHQRVSKKTTKKVAKITKTRKVAA